MIVTDEMVLNRARAIINEMAVIDMVWTIRCVEDATDEDEWLDYENLTGLLAELAIDYPHLYETIIQMRRNTVLLR